MREHAELRPKNDKERTDGAILFELRHILFFAAATGSTASTACWSATTKLDMYIYIYTNICGHVSTYRYIYIYISCSASAHKHLLLRNVLLHCGNGLHVFRRLLERHYKVGLSQRHLQTKWQYPECMSEQSKHIYIYSHGLSGPLSMHTWMTCVSRPLVCIYKNLYVQIYIYIYIYDHVYIYI